MSARKNKVFQISIISKTKRRFIENRCYSNLYKVMCLFLMIIFSLPLYSDEFPVWFRLKSDDKYTTLNWEKSLCSENFSAEQKIESGKWEEVPGLQRKVKVGLALAGGIVRGVAHIGVLRILEENYIPIDGVSGTSMGSIIGGLYVSGYSPDSLEWVVKEDIDWETFFYDHQPRMYTPIWERIRNKPRPPAMEVGLSWKRPFILYKPGTGIRIAQKFTDEIADKTLQADYRAGFDFSKLKYPFGAVLTDLNNVKSTLKKHGTLSTVLRASGSFPMAFEPMIIKNVQYVDGGILDNLPVDAFLQDFDPIRKPDSIITIHDEEKGEDIFVIASYPSKLRGARNKPIETGEVMSGLLGIGVLGKTSSLAREFHVWNSWDNADGRIDIDVQGGFDFNKKKLGELIKTGYDAAKNQIDSIKRGIAEKEDGIDSLDISREVFKVSSIKIFHVKDNDTLENEVNRAIKRAMKLKVGSIIERNDVCYALRNIYNTGDYKNVGARVDKETEGLEVEFFLTEKDKYLEPLNVMMIMGGNDYDDSLVAGEVYSFIRKGKRKLNFYEIKELVEKEYVERGYIGPLVSGAAFSSFEDKDMLFVHGDRGKYLEGVKIFQEDNDMKKAIQQEFKPPLSPRKILKKNKEIYNKYQLKTISVEGMEKDLLSIRVRPKTGHTLEFPVLSLDKDEGLNLFAELRTKSIRGFGDRSFYVNFWQNFPLKSAKELIQGHNYNIGVNKCSPLRISFWSLLPDLSLGNRRLRYPSLRDTTLYDMQYDEYLFGKVSYPVYRKDFAFSIGVESYYRAYLNDSLLPRPIIGFFKMQCDNLDRYVFPSSGTKISIEAAIDLEERLWNKAKLKGIYAKGFRFQNKLKTVLTGELYFSGCSEAAPFVQKYSMGGITPIGSYQLRLHDYEDLPGYSRNEFIEEYMFKVGGSARLTIVEMQVLGVRANIHFIGSAYVAGASDSFSSLFEENSIHYAPSIGFYLDTSFLNFGIGWANTDRNIYHDMFASLVLYGVGF